MKYLSLFVILTLIPLTAASCDRPMPPKGPDHLTATSDQLFNSVGEIRIYMKAAIKYIDCMEEKGETVKLIEEMNTIIDLHNQRLRAYKDRLRMGQQADL